MGQALIKSIVGLRTPNIGGYEGYEQTSGYNHDLSFRGPKGFRNSEDLVRNHSTERVVEQYTPQSVAFKPGFRCEFNEDDAIVVLRGGAGQGKTTFLRALVNSIQKPSTDLDDLYAYQSGQAGTRFSNGLMLQRDFNEKNIRAEVLKYERAIDKYHFPYKLDRRSDDELLKALGMFMEAYVIGSNFRSFNP